MVLKEDGAEMTCRSCGTDVICHMSNYKGDFKNKLQWQNEDGTAHYSTNNGKDFTCNIPEQETDKNEIELKSNEKSTIPKNIPHNLTSHEMLERIYDMMLDMYEDFCDKKLKELKS